MSNADLSHLYPRAKFLDQVFDQLPEIHPTIRGKIDHNFTILKKTLKDIMYVKQDRLPRFSNPTMDY